MVRQTLIKSVIKGEMADIWNLFTQEEKSEMLTHFEVRSLKKDCTIYKEGEDSKFLMCLIRGKVKLTKEGVGGRYQIIRLIRPLQYFGFHAYFANIPYTANAITLESSIVAFLPMDILESYMYKNSKLSHFFVKQTAGELLHSDNMIVSLTQKHIRGRLAESLFRLRDFYGLSDDSTLEAKFSREDLANLSNMTTSNAIRTLSAFAKEGLIEVNGRNIKILDEERLSKISKFGW
ncbi:MAG: Crp/Fnr family transcriptional regulator [Bacteroidales bacterium]|nr:Crp/Fnr family transcriptional regulator [Bacteroidales bacterium]